MPAAGPTTSPFADAAAIRNGRMAQRAAHGSGRRPPSGGESRLSVSCFPSAVSDLGRCVPARRFPGSHRPVALPHARRCSRWIRCLNGNVTHASCPGLRERGDRACQRGGLVALPSSPATGARLSAAALVVVTLSVPRRKWRRGCESPDRTGTDPARNAIWRRMTPMRGLEAKGRSTGMQQAARS